MKFNAYKDDSVSASSQRARQTCAAYLYKHCLSKTKSTICLLIRLDLEDCCVCLCTHRPAGMFVSESFMFVGGIRKTKINKIKWIELRWIDTNSGHSSLSDHNFKPAYSIHQSVCDSNCENGHEKNVNRKVRWRIASQNSDTIIWLLEATSANRITTHIHKRYEYYGVQSTDCRSTDCPGVENVQHLFYWYHFKFSAFTSEQCVAVDGGHSHLFALLLPLPLLLQMLLVLCWMRFFLYFCLSLLFVRPFFRLSLHSPLVTYVTR